MKRQYVVPGITIEHYARTQGISACITKINALDEQCILQDADATDFMKSFAMAGYFVEGACQESASGLDGFDLICYHTSVQAAFTS